MKRKVLSVIMAAVMLCCLMPTTAFALPEGNITDAKTEVSYTVIATEGYYEVEIPKKLNLNESDCICFGASNLNISENQLLTIRLDSSRTLTGGKLILSNAYTETISASLLRIDKDSGYASELNITNNPIVATFSESGVPGDYMRIVPEYSYTTRPGEYLGYIYFTISVENK